jgi:hypothetical protein
MDPVLIVMLIVFVGFPLAILLVAWMWPVE